MKNATDNNGQKSGSQKKDFRVNSDENRESRDRPGAQGLCCDMKSLSEYDLDRILACG